MADIEVQVVAIIQDSLRVDEQKFISNKNCSQVGCITCAPLGFFLLFRWYCKKRLPHLKHANSGSWRAQEQNDLCPNLP